MSVFGTPAARFTYLDESGIRQPGKRPVGRKVWLSQWRIQREKEGKALTGEQPGLPFMTDIERTLQRMNLSTTHDRIAQRKPVLAPEDQHRRTYENISVHPCSSDSPTASTAYSEAVDICIMVWLYLVCYTSRARLTKFLKAMRCTENSAFRLGQEFTTSSLAQDKPRILYNAICRAASQKRRVQSSAVYKSYGFLRGNEAGLGEPFGVSEVNVQSWCGTARITDRIAPLVPGYGEDLALQGSKCFTRLKMGEFHKLLKRK